MRFTYMFKAQYRRNGPKVKDNFLPYFGWKLGGRHGVVGEDGVVEQLDYELLSVFPSQQAVNRGMADLVSRGDGTRRTSCFTQHA